MYHYKNSKWKEKREKGKITGSGSNYSQGKGSQHEENYKQHDQTSESWERNADSSS